MAHFVRRVHPSGGTSGNCGSCRGRDVARGRHLAGGGKGHRWRTHAKSEARGTRRRNYEAHMDDHWRS